MDSPTTFPHDRDCHEKENLLVAQGNFRYDIKFSTKSTGPMSTSFMFMVCVVWRGWVELNASCLMDFLRDCPRAGEFELNTPCSTVYKQ